MALGNPGKGSDDAREAAEEEEEDKVRGPQLAALTAPVGCEAAGMHSVASGRDI